MQSILELKLQEARYACEIAQGNLYQRQFAHWLMRNDFYYFADELEYQTRLLDEALGLIGVSQTSLNRVEALSQTLLKDGFQPPTISLFQISSNRAAVAQELAYLWNDDEGRREKIEKLLLEFNESLRYMQRARNSPATKWAFDLLGFPTIASFPKSLDLGLIKEHFEPEFQQAGGHTIIEIPVNRLAKRNLHNRQI